MLLTLTVHLVNQQRFDRIQLVSSELVAGDDEQTGVAVCNDCGPLTKTKPASSVFLSGNDDTLGLAGTVAMSAASFIEMAATNQEKW